MEAVHYPQEHAAARVPCRVLLLVRVLLGGDGGVWWVLAVVTHQSWRHSWHNVCLLVDGVQYDEADLVFLSLAHLHQFMSRYKILWWEQVSVP